MEIRGNHSLPWNQQTFTGYFFKVFYCNTVGAVYMLLNGTFSLLFVFFCFNHQAFYEQFRHMLNKMNNLNGNSSKKANLCELIIHNNMTKKYVKIAFNSFYNLILLHSSFLHSSADVYSQFIMIDLICRMLMLSFAVYQLDLVKNLNFYSLLDLNLLAP